MNLLTSLRNGFLTLFGDIKVFRYPMFLIYDPGGYRVKGDEIRSVINTLEKGDILIRGYKNYLDGYFIPGFFSHAGLYLGEVRDEDRELAPDWSRDKVYTGPQIVIHAMAEGVFMEDVINFCRCDYLLVLRRSTKVETKEEIDSSFGEIFKTALSCLGKGYDFKFDFSDYGHMSCTEFVYHCGDFYLSKYAVKLKKKWALVRKMEMLIPDDFVTRAFDIAFASRSIKPGRLERILEKNE